MRFLFVWLSVVIAISGVGLAAPPETGMHLLVTGPDRQWVSVAVGYFGDDGALMPGSPKTKRLQLTEGRATMPLEKGRAGYAVNVLSPTQRPIVIQLRKDDKTIDQKEASRAGRIMVRSGQIKSIDKVVAPEISLSKAHRSIVGKMLTAFIEGDTKSAVSDATIANIDWPSLDAYSFVTRQIMGAVEPDDTLDGWATWNGKRNARIYAGPLRFDGGETNVILAVIDNRLVDFIIRSERLPDQWFIGPAALQAYTTRAEKLLQFMFEGKTLQAHGLFSHRVQKEITVDKLQGVHQTLTRRFGDAIDEIKFRTSRIDPVKDPNNRNLTLSFDIVTNKETICDAAIEILLDRAVGTIPRGHLTSFNVREKGPTLPAEQRQMVEDVIAALLKGDSAPLIAQLDPLAKALVDKKRLEAEVVRWEEEFGKMRSDIVWTDWADVPGGRAVEGPVVIASGVVIVRVDFADNRLLGVTLTGNTYAGSTLDQLVGLRKITDHGRTFWTRLFSNKKTEAYRMLPDVFRKQLSREQFEQMGDKIGAIAKIGVDDVTLQSIRLDSRGDRVEPVMVSACYRIKFKNETYQGARCEYHVARNAKFAIYNFNTEFADQFPVPFEPYVGFVTAVTSGKPENVIRLFHPTDRAEIDPLVLGALMKQIRESLGELTDEPLKGVAQRRYENGAQRSYVAADLPLKEASVPAQWSYLYGWLKSFDIESAKLVRFANRIEDTSAYRRRGIELFSLWFENKIPETVESLIPTLRSDKTAAQLSELRESVVEKLGSFRSVSFESESFDEKANVLRQVYKLTFDDGTATGTIAIMFDAMHSHIGRANVNVDEPGTNK